MPTQEQIDKILNKNLQNIVNKLKEGKTLTHKEVELLENQKKESGEIPKKAKNITELAKILNVPRKTIYEWRTKPDAPTTEKGNINVKAWIDWVAVNSRKGTSESKKINPTLAYKYEQIKNLKIKNDQLLGQLIDQDVVIEVIEGLVFIVRENILKSGMSVEARDVLLQELKKKKDVFFGEIIEKNRRSMDDSEKHEPSTMG